MIANLRNALGERHLGAAMEPVAEFSSADGRRVASVLLWPDGLYELREAVLAAAPEGDRWEHRSSGLFQTLGDAEAAAHAAAHAAADG
jgi:hypothetical protein